MGANVGSPSDPTYAQECSLGETALKLAEHAPEAEQLALQQFVWLSRTLGSADVWEVLSDANWRTRVLGSVEERVLALLIEAFSILQVSAQDKWFSLLPHYLAELCETAADDERRLQLFRCVIHTSLVSDTVSAVRRLLRGPQKAKFVEMAAEYREHVEASWSVYPPWVQGRFRGLLAALHVV